MKKIEKYKNDFIDYLTQNPNITANQFIDNMQIIGKSGRRQEMLEFYREYNNIPNPSLIKQQKHIPLKYASNEEREIRQVVKSNKDNRQEIDKYYRLIERNNLLIKQTNDIQKQETLKRKNKYNLNRINLLSDKIIERTKRKLTISDVIERENQELIEYYRVHQVIIKNNIYWIKSENDYELFDQIKILEDSKGNIKELVYLTKHPYKQI